MRLFVALDLPLPTRAALAAWTAAAAPPELRRVPAANMHLTLVFLGTRSEDEAARVAEALVARKRRRLGLLHSAGALWLPPRRPGVLAVALRDDPELTIFQREFTNALDAAIGVAPDRHAFRPHVTVARVPRRTRFDRRLYPFCPEFSFRAPTLTLYRSLDGPDGVRYEPLTQVVTG